jgi:SOS-response transcriptional repressor LexA
MHPLQQKLLKVAAARNLGQLSFREIGKLIGEEHPQKVKHHLKQLEKKGLIRSIAEGVAIKKTGNQDGIVSIPILGAADCGPATIFAEENVEGYLRISRRLISFSAGLFALRAVGNSMNNASIKGKNLENGDYTIIDSRVRDPENDDYVVSIIGGVCNIKKFIKDTKNKQIVLLSESTQDLPPIHIHPEEAGYFVSGRVVDVVKSPEAVKRHD